ncbi:MAG: hypothetical protein ACLFV7_12935 [Phycisphaerae bacterium]
MVKRILAAAVLTAVLAAPALLGGCDGNQRRIERSYKADDVPLSPQKSVVD